LNFRPSRNSLFINNSIKVHTKETISRGAEIQEFREGKVLPIGSKIKSKEFYKRNFWVFLLYIWGLYLIPGSGFKARTSKIKTRNWLP
jgi:hypothetical protein